MNTGQFDASKHWNKHGADYDAYQKIGNGCHKELSSVNVYFGWNTKKRYC